MILRIPLLNLLFFYLIYLGALSQSSRLPTVAATPDMKPFGHSDGYDRYLIEMKKGLGFEDSKKIENFIKSVGGSVLYRLENVFDGHIVRLPKSISRAELESLNAAEVIENDIEMTSSQIQQTDGYTYGIDLMDGGYDGKYSFNSTGSGVHIYILDSPIDTAHPEFAGRAKTLFKIPGIDESCTEHGTHVAGIAGGTNVGIAKLANLYSVAVLDCDTGYETTVVAGIDYVIGNHKKPAIINMSLGPKGESTKPTLLSRAIQRAMESGISVVIAAGNEDQDGCNGTPAATPGALAVAAVDKSNRRSYFSNFGPCISIHAPGSEIASAKAGGGFNLKSGTSQAAPFVTGVAALYLESNPTASPQEVSEAIKNSASKGIVSDVKTSPNLLLQSVYQPDSSFNGEQLVQLLPPEDIADSISPIPRILRYIVYAAIGIVVLMVLVVVAHLMKKRLDKSRKAVTNRTLFNQTLPISIETRSISRPETSVIHDYRSSRSLYRWSR